MSVTPVWKGADTFAETPNSPVSTADPTKTVVVRTYEGTYAECVSNTPSMGATYSDLPGDVIVVGTNVMRMPGGRGRLTVNLETPYQTTFEIEWVEIDKPLILNPRYWDGSTADLTPAGAKPLDLTDRNAIDSWEHEDDAALKCAYRFKVIQQSGTTTFGGGAYSTYTATTTGVTIPGYEGTFNIYTLSANAKDYAAKRLKGEEAYRIWAPVVRQTSESLSKPSVAACGLLQNPPTAAGAPTGYTWQLSANRTTRTGPYGKYRLQLEWQGADRIDADIYGTASPTTAPDP